MSLCERPLIKLSVAEEGARDGGEPSIRLSRFLLTLLLFVLKGSAVCVDECLSESGHSPRPDFFKTGHRRRQNRFLHLRAPEKERPVL
ncbi:uncharacterized [Tachysurus ichikawai]